MLSYAKRLTMLLMFCAMAAASAAGQVNWVTP
jgi:hypothetical protein